MTSCASASRAPAKVRTTSVPRWPPRGMMPLTVGDAAREGFTTEAQRHRENKIRKCLTIISCLTFVAFSVPLCLCGSTSSQQFLPELPFVHDDDRPIARRHELLVRVDAELVVDRVREVLNRERIVLRLAGGRVGGAVD